MRQLLAGEQSCLQAQVQGAVRRAPPATVARNMMISPPPVVQLATLAADYLCLMRMRRGGYRAGSDRLGSDRLSSLWLVKLTSWLSSAC